VGPAARVGGEVIDVTSRHLVEGADAVLLHVAPVELERKQCDGERVLDQAPGPPFGEVIDVQACGALVQNLPHAASVVLDEHVIEKFAGISEVARLAGEQLGDVQVKLLVGALACQVDGLLELDGVGRLPRQTLPEGGPGVGEPSLLDRGEDAIALHAHPWLRSCGYFDGAHLPVRCAASSLVGTCSCSPVSMSRTVITPASFSDAP